MRNYEKLWFTIKLKAAQLAFDGGQIEKLTKELEDLKNFCRDMDVGNPKAYDERKGTQLMSLYALEIQMYTIKQDEKMLRKLYQSASDARLMKSAVPPPKIMGIIKECGGKMFMQQQQWKEAEAAFFDAFRNYDDAGHPKRIQCLTYLVLGNMLSGSAINPFHHLQARPYKNDPEMIVLAELSDAYRDRHIKQFERVLAEHGKKLRQDLYFSHFLDLLKRKAHIHLGRCLSVEAGAESRRFLMVNNRAGGNNGEEMPPAPLLSHSLRDFGQI